MQMKDASGPRRVRGRLVATYTLAGLAVVAVIVFPVATFALAFGHGEAFWPMLISAALTILALAAGIVVSPFTRLQRPTAPPVPPVPPGPPPLYRDTHVSAGARFSLGVVETTGEPYLAIPVSNGVVDHAEHYRLTAEEYAALARDEAAGARLADRCRRRELDDRLLHRPDEHRGIPT